MTLTGQPRRAPHTQTQLSIRIAGRELGDAVRADLLQVRVQRGVRTVGRATITLVDRSADLVGGQLKIGAEAVIASVEPAEVLLEGTVTAVAMDAGPGGTTVTATVQDRAYGLARGSAIASYKDLAPADVVKRLAEAASLTPNVTGSLGPKQAWSLGADSALGVIDELAERAGCDWCVDGKAFLVWDRTKTAPRAGDVRVELGVGLRTLSVRQTGTGRTTFDVRGWDSVERTKVVGSATSSTPRSGFAPPKGETTTVVVTRRAVSTADDASTVAQGLAASVGRVSGRAAGEFLPEVRPGGTITVTAAGAADGTYYVREVEHTFDAGTLRTVLVLGESEPARLTEPWRATRPLVSSIQRSGVVVGTVDKVNDPKGIGRVSVQLTGLANDVSSTWARVLSPGAGTNRGWALLPEVGDEVLVAFEDDDLRRPVVLGGLYSSGSKTLDDVYGRRGDATVRRLTSRLGHVIELGDGDAPKKQHVLLAAAVEGRKQRLRIGTDRADLDIEKGPLRISAGGAAIEFDGSGGIKINATKITIVADGDVAVEGTKVVTKGKAAVESSAPSVTASAQTMLTVKSNGTAQISGSVVKIN